jgi:chaperonin GroEL
MTKHYDSDFSLQQKLLEGVNILANNVASTLGPRGRNVILQPKGKSPIVTKDGVTVAKFVDLEDPIQNAGAQILKQVSEKTNTNAGDGTTTATVLARAILVEAQKHLVAGASPVELKRGMDKITKSLVENLKAQSRPITSIDDIKDIATISANGDKMIGSLVATAIDQAGKDGAITVEEARSIETSLDIVEGFRLPSGYLSPQFITEERRAAVKYEDCFILVCDSKIETVEEILPVLEVVAREARPLMIVAESVEGQALAALIMNSIRGSMKIVAVKAPFYGEERRSALNDLALSCGATLISKEKNLELSSTKLEHLGRAKSVDVTSSMTTIIDGSGDHEQVEERIETLKSQMQEEDSEDLSARMQNRITRLASGIAIIRVGAATEVEMIEKKHRLEDALEAVKSAKEEGIIPGGGIALVRAATEVECKLENSDQLEGARIILKAIEAPMRQMSENAGVSADVTLSNVRGLEPTHGYNFSTGKYVDMFEAGIVDPLRVTREALQNATSAASTLLTTNYAIIEA